MAQVPLPSVRQTVRYTAQTRLQTEPTTQTVLHLVAQTTQQAMTEMAQALGGTRPDCTAGCAFCCYHPVDITAPEALAMVHYLRTTLAPEVVAATYERVAAQAAKVRDLSFEAHAQAKIPCALLVHGTCSVYPARPFACRAWHSMSVSRCEAIFVAGDPVSMIPPLDTGAYEAVWDVARGLAEGCQQARLDGKSYELHSLLLRVLETPAAGPRWLQGEDILAGCTVGAFPMG
jgi:Fe-S-cluster containining protein